MSFIVRCPFCKEEMECPDNTLGQVAQCISCGREIDLEPVGGSPAAADDQTARAVRAAAIAGRMDTMPRVTWEWAFEAVWKISIAAAVIDGFIYLIIWLIMALVGQSSHRYRF